MLTCLICLAVTAPTASAATAPARVAYPAGATFDSGGTLTGATGAAALPDGSVVTFAYDDVSQTTTALKLLPNGALDPSFGHGGAVALDAAGPGLRVIASEPLAAPDLRTRRDDRPRAALRDRHAAAARYRQGRADHGPPQLPRHPHRDGHRRDTRPAALNARAGGR